MSYDAQEHAPMLLWNELYAGSRVRRYHTGYGAGLQHSVGEHAAGVALLAAAVCGHDLGKPPSPDLLLYCITHDYAEQYAGDVPAPVKWARPGLKEELDLAEEAWASSRRVDACNVAAFASAGSRVDLSDEEWSVFRLCDLLELMNHAAGAALFHGNTFALLVYERGWERLKCGDPYKDPPDRRVGRRNDGDGRESGVNYPWAAGFISRMDVALLEHFKQYHDPRLGASYAPLRFHATLTLRTREAADRG